MTGETGPRPLLPGGASRKLQLQQTVVVLRTPVETSISLCLATTVLVTPKPSSDEVALARRDPGGPRPAEGSISARVWVPPPRGSFSR